MTNTQIITTDKGAKSNTTSQNKQVDYFFKSGNFRFRPEQEVFSDMDKIWDEDPLNALKIIFYNRLITRKTKGFFQSDKIQKGQGAKDEFIKSLKWLELNHPRELFNNLWLIPIIGTWKDLWYDSANTGYYHYICPEKVYELIKRGLKDPYNRQLIAKFLPRIRSNSNIKNDRHKRINKWARGLCDYLRWSEKDYRLFKSDPNNQAHLWQRLACKNLWEHIEFGKIPGRALLNLVARKGKDNKTTIERHNLSSKFNVWLDTQPTVKFNGYPYELYKIACKNLNPPNPIIQRTINKQFDGLIELAKRDRNGGLNGNIWCALDTSSSMESKIFGSVVAIDVCVGLGIYFSALNEGAFKDHVVMFDDESRVVKLEGTFVDRVKQINCLPTAWGSTNFQSIIDEIVRVRKEHPEILLSDYPETILVISDMQFDISSSDNTQTNYETAISKLKDVGIEKMKFIWWNVSDKNKDVPATIKDEGVTLISGFDPAIITLILGGTIMDNEINEERTLNPYENMLKALDQEILNQLKIG